MTTSTETLSILKRQLSNFWCIDGCIDDNVLLSYIEKAIAKTEKSHDASNRVYYKKTGFDVMNTNVYCVFLYYLSNLLGKDGYSIADKIYYLNKIMHGIEIYWNVNLPDHFIVEHPLGSVIGKATFGDYFSCFQGVTVGANFVEDQCVWPIIGDNVTMYANSTVIGNCKIGNNVIISANTFLLDIDIPDNSIVYGCFPNLKIKTLSEEEIKNKVIRIWNWKSNSL